MLLQHQVYLFRMGWEKKAICSSNPQSYVLFLWMLCLQAQVFKLLPSQGSWSHCSLSWSWPYKHPNSLQTFHGNCILWKTIEIFCNHNSYDLWSDRVSLNYNILFHYKLPCIPGGFAACLTFTLINFCNSGIRQVMFPGRSVLSMVHLDYSLDVLTRISTRKPGDQTYCEWLSLHSLKVREDEAWFSILWETSRGWGTEL